MKKAASSKTFVIYEVWTRHSVVKLPLGGGLSSVLAQHEPKPVKGMNLSNWHAVEVKP